MKIVIVGAGNAGCFTALHYAWYTRGFPVEIELIYDPSTPVEKVGQATFTSPPELLSDTIGFNWYNNQINATFKSGILYEGWGKKKDNHFHSFIPNQMAMHYCPWEMQEAVLKSGWFKVTEGDVDPKDVDANYVFDCRGKPKDFSDYEELKNPTNACLLGKPNWDTTKALWSRHVATPNGWTFIIPTHSNSPSHDYSVGYCYNNNITSQENAEKNMLEMFDVDITRHISYKNYIAKNPVIDNRIFLNGNRLFFLEPLESSSLESYLQWTRFSYDAIITNKRSIDSIKDEIRRYIEKVQNFILWHYHFGSQYDTSFWKYAQTLKFKDVDFNLILKNIRKASFSLDFPQERYAQWFSSSIKNWEDGMDVL
tara:strand:- start:860 stop:1963 length:1104 start_codon:yes stop_codon:yes gene_type:complete